MLTVEHAIGLFLDSLVDRGRLETSVLTQGYQLRRFFRSALDEPLHNLSKKRMRQLDEELAAAKSRKTSTPLSSETVTFSRETARRFTRWCALQGRLSADPLSRAGRKPIMRLHDEVTQLRAELETVRKERDQLRQQLRAAGGAR